MLCIILLSLSVISGSVSNAERDYFTAAVFENTYIDDKSGDKMEEIVSINLKKYEKATEKAAAEGADMIVLPEFGLFPHNKNRNVMKRVMEYIPDPEITKSNPCREQEIYKNRPILRSLSCMAEQNKIYVIANMGDIQYCEPPSNKCYAGDMPECSFDDVCTAREKVYMYNSDVAFDREGNLIARYHKNHLYFEVLNTPVQPEMVTFKTDFGICGMIVCFDSVFKDAVELVEMHNVEHLLFPTHWFDDIVPLNGIEWQQSWALANKVNFIGSNAHVPSNGSLGSGIFSKYHGALAYTYNPDGKSKLVVARVPRRNAAIEPKASTFILTGEGFEKTGLEDGSSFPEQCYDKLVGPARESEPDYRCYKAQAAKYALHKLESGKRQAEVCQNGFCCKASYSTNKMTEDYYLAVFNGTNDVRGYFKWAEETCMIVRCDPSDGKSCITFPSRANTVFHYVELKATFTTKYIYPTVSTNNYRLAPKSKWQFETSETEAVLRYENDVAVPLLKVGMMGRCYERDPPFVPFHQYR